MEEVAGGEEVTKQLPGRIAVGFRQGMSRESAMSVSPPLLALFRRKRMVPVLERQLDSPARQSGGEYRQHHFQGFHSSVTAASWLAVSGDGLQPIVHYALVGAGNASFRLGGTERGIVFQRTPLIRLAIGRPGSVLERIELWKDVRQDFERALGSDEFQAPGAGRLAIFGATAECGRDALRKGKLRKNLIARNQANVFGGRVRVRQGDLVSVVQDPRRAPKWVVGKKSHQIEEVD